MRILILDASSDSGSLAVLEKGEITHERQFPSGRREGGALFLELQELIREIEKAEQIVVGLGPGSYSGIRQVVALAEGLACAWQSELVGIPSPCGLSEECRYIALGDARKGTYYYTEIEAGKPVDGPILKEEATLREKLSQSTLPVFSTDALAAFPSIPVCKPSARLIGKAALLHWDQIRLNRLEPLYLRAPNITTAVNPPLILS